MIDATHDAARRSWVESANSHPDFPIQNLPFVVFSPKGEGARGGVAIGEEILDLAKVASLLTGAAAKAAAAAAGPLLNPLFALGTPARSALRASLSHMFDTDQRAEFQAQCRPFLHRASDCMLRLPARIGDYTDFYAGIHHATNVGRHVAARQSAAAELQVPADRLSRPRVVDRGFGRAGAAAARSAQAAAAQPCRRSDRAAASTTSSSSASGSGRATRSATPIPIAHGGERTSSGFCLLNDWSARDIQAWEYQPLGRSSAKSFATTISPWVVTPEALAPFRIAPMPRADGDPRPLDYLMTRRPGRGGARHRSGGARSSRPRCARRALPPQRLARSNARHLYWTVAQMVAHHACSGCNLQPGDLFGSGTDLRRRQRRHAAACLSSRRAGGEPIALVPRARRGASSKTATR